jgi:hypothetical protein
MPSVAADCGQPGAGGAALLARISRTPAKGSTARGFEISDDHHGSATPQWRPAAQPDRPASRPIGQG